MTTVVDASVVVDWIAPDVAEDAPALAVPAQLALHGEAVVAPRLMRLEVANAMLSGIRRGRWSGAEADMAVQALRAMPVATVDDQADVEAAFELSRRYDNHPVYDMVYVALASRLGATLLTADQRLLAKTGHLGFVQAV